MGNCAPSLCGKKRQIVNSNILCLVCEARIDVDKRTTFKVCPNAHHLCIRCQQSILVLQALKRRCYLECPFCDMGSRKEVSLQVLVKIHPNLINQLIEEEKVLNSLPQIVRELFIFSRVYLHELHKAILEGTRIQSIDAVRLRGKLLPDYSPLQMSMFNCLPNLRRLSLKNTDISSINTKDFSRSRLQLLNLNNNSFSLIKELLMDNLHVFRYLRQLGLRKNNIKNIAACQKLEFLKILDLSCNQIKSMEGLQNLPALTDLNLEFNEITEFVFHREFSQLRSFCLYGNPIRAGQWKRFSQEKWDELRLLTVSVKASEVQEEINTHSRIRYMKWRYMQLIVYQLPLAEEQNFREFQKSQFKFDKITVLKVSRPTYEIYSDRVNGFLAKTMLKIRHYNRFGTNINFRVGSVTNADYNIDQNTFKMTKMNNQNDPINFLYHRKILDLRRQEKMFFEFQTPASEIIVGLYFLNSPNEYLENRLQNSIRLSFIKEQQLKRSISFEKGVNHCVCSVNFKEKQETFTIIVNGSKQIEHDLVGISDKFQFFIHLPQSDDQLKIIRYEYE